MYAIEFSREAKKDLKGFPKKDIGFILKKIYSIRESPIRHIERLTGMSFWKLRIGEYRAVLFVETNKKIIYVVKIGHRKNIYERM